MQKVLISAQGAQFIFDVTFKETHSFTNTLTQHPVQTGAAINDHVYQQPINFTWDVGQSDCLGTASGSMSRSATAFTVLRSLWAGAVPVTITTEFQQYTNMVIKSFVVNRDKSTMYGMRATVVFQQIIESNAVSISVSQKTTAVPQTTGKTTTANKATKTATTANQTNAKANAALGNIFPGLSWLFNWATNHGG